MNWKQPIDTRLINDFGDDYAAHALYVMLLLRANNERRSVGVGKKYIVVERGQVLFSRALFAKYLCWSDKMPERVLQRLVENHQKVTKQVTKNGTIISIFNYDEIVKLDQVNVQQVTKKRPSSDQVVTTNKNEKNSKNEKSEKKHALKNFDALTNEACEEIAVHYNVNNRAVVGLREELELYCQSTGKSYKDYRAALMNWVRRALETGKIKPLPKQVAMPVVEEVASNEVRLQHAEKIRATLTEKLGMGGSP